MRLIDADALKLDFVEKGQRSKRYKLGEIWELNFDEIREVIDEQPTIEPERKKGKWMIIDGCAYCSACRCNYKKAIMTHANFCPNCGAEMRGGKDETD